MSDDLRTMIGDAFKAQDAERARAKQRKLQEAENERQVRARQTQENELEKSRYFNKLFEETAYQRALLEPLFIELGENKFKPAWYCAYIRVTPDYWITDGFSGGQGHWFHARDIRFIQQIVVVALDQDGSAGDFEQIRSMYALGSVMNPMFQAFVLMEGKGTDAKYTERWTSIEDTLRAVYSALRRVTKTRPAEHIDFTQYATNLALYPKRKPGDVPNFESSNA